MNDYDKLVWMHGKMTEAEDAAAYAYTNGKALLGDDERFDNAYMALCDALCALQEAKKAIRRAAEELYEPEGVA